MEDPREAIYYYSYILLQEFISPAYYYYTVELVFFDGVKFHQI